MHLSKFTLFTALSLTAAAASACDLCAIYNINDLHGGAPGWRLGIAEQFTHFKTLHLDGREVGNAAGQHLDSSVTQILLGHNFNDRLSLQLSVPLIYRDFRRTEEAGVRDDHTEGLGDIALTANAVLVRHDAERFAFMWTATAGVKLPTGSTRRLKEETLEGHTHADADHEETAPAELPESGIHGHDLTLGSGSWDAIVGTSIYARYERAFFTGSVQYSIRTEGDYHYRFADDLSWNAGPGFYLALREKYTVALQAVCSGEHKPRDTFRGARSEDTGITAVYLGPELSVTYKDRMSAEIGVDLPVHLDNTALQIVPDLRLRAAFSVRF